MIFVNASSHPTPEVRRLIDAAAEPYDLTRCLVRVHDTPHPYRGLAYGHLPHKWWGSATAGMRYAVLVCVGPAIKFAVPVSNVKTRRRWIRMEPDEIAPLFQPVRSTYGPDMKVMYRSRMVSSTAPYGGKKSPLILFHDWQEALLGVAAHEFHHISQYQRGVATREWPCERAAAAALELYRAQKLPDGCDTIRH